MDKTDLMKRLCFYKCAYIKLYPDSKVHGDNMGPIWGRQVPGGSHVGPWTLLSGYVSECVPVLSAPNLLEVINVPVLYTMLPAPNLLSVNHAMTDHYQLVAPTFQQLEAIARCQGS